jgi:hypothetical protein
MKKEYKLIITTFFLIISANLVLSQKTDVEGKWSQKEDLSSDLRSGCAPSQSLSTKSVNNVRLKLMGGGDLWYDLRNPGYYIPNPPASSADKLRAVIYAGALWLGGYDEGGNLKLAAQTYRQRGNDYWPGPIDQSSADVTPDVCENWDRQFMVHGSVIKEHISLIASILTGSNAIIPDEYIHQELKRWPAQGNPYFASQYGFELPDQILAPFYDHNGDGLYNPAHGDFPVRLSKNCSIDLENTTGIPDQMQFWIFNDIGNEHTQSNGMPLGMEIHAMSYAFAADDELNDMTFQSYRIINRSYISLDSFVIGKWIDFDLGCPDDDYVGYEVDRQLAYVYNAGSFDGPPGVDCQGNNSYEDKIPLAGLKVLSTPENEFDEEIGISSFMYYLSHSIGNQNISTPFTAQHHYFYMTSRWRNGQQLTFGGYGYPIGSGPFTPTQFAYTGAPDDPSGWTLCPSYPPSDYRVVTSTGKFTSTPGQVHHINYANVWVPNEKTYPCPDITRLTYAADKAQVLFDNCFIDFVPEGPDAPDMDIIEMDSELIVVLSNDESTSNNANEAFKVHIPLLPELDAISDSSYTFEGYKIYQLQNPTIKPEEYDNPDKARLIFQSDIRNDVTEIINYVPLQGYAGTEGPVYESHKMVSGVNQGLRKSLNISYDYFSGAPLVNHKRYFYSVVAYAQNNYMPFDEYLRLGQRTPYLQGKGNVQVYTGIPRNLEAEFPGLGIQSHYGETPAMLRLDGTGNGGLFVDIEDASRERIVQEGFVDSLHYRRGSAPVNVFVFDPIRLQSGNYRLRLFDEFMEAPLERDEVHWELSNLDDLSQKWVSSHSISAQNEQFIPEHGLAIRLGDVYNPGEAQAFQNGYIPAEVMYENGGESWFRGVPDMPGTSGFFETEGAILYDEIFRMQRTMQLEPDHPKDKNRNWARVAGGMWHPYSLLNPREFQTGYVPTSPYNIPYGPYLSPAWITQQYGLQIQANNALNRVNNVDIVLTPDKSKWSRCVVVESANLFYNNADNLPTIGGAMQFDLRQSPSVGKYDLSGNGLADPDDSGIGMGWFPGYAVDVMTGRRLNIFFGENSFYSDEIAAATGISSLPTHGGDMMWNPTDEYKLDLTEYGLSGSLAEIVMGGQHMIYVSRTDYDECDAMYDLLSETGEGSDLAKRQLLYTISWASFPVMEEGFDLTSLGSSETGLIPSEVIFKLRANSRYQHYEANLTNEGYPDYIFSTADMAAGKDPAKDDASMLDLIGVVPNPYYAYSMYEANALDRRIRITNLPGPCTISIFSLDGRLLKRIIKDDHPLPPESKPGFLPGQILTSVDWDLTDDSGNLISSGVYLIHVEIPGVGEKVLKWFGVMRQS